MNLLPLLLLLFITITFAQNFTIINGTRPCNDSVECGEFVCRFGFCSNCTSHTQCQEKGSLLICKQQGNNYSCLHKSLLDIHGLDVLLFIVTFLFSALCSITGIGPAAFLIPLSHSIGQFSLIHSISISRSAVLGMVVANSIILSRFKVTNSNYPVSNWDLILLLYNGGIIGTVFGILFLLFMPTVVILIFISLILLIGAIRTIWISITMWKKESIEMVKDEKMYELIPQDEIKIERGLWGDIFKIFICVGLFFLFTILSLITGGKGIKSIANVKNCSTVYWILYSINYPIFITTILIIMIYLMLSYYNSIKKGYNFHPFEPQWTFTRTVMCSIIAISSAGIAAAGGASMTRNSWLVDWGIDPVISSASCNFFLVFECLTLLVIFATHGLLPFDYSGVMFVIGLLAAIVGQLMFHFVYQRTKRKSIILIVVSILMLLALFMMIGDGIYKMVIYSKAGQIWKLNSPCE